MTEEEKEIEQLDRIAKQHFDKGEYYEAIHLCNKILVINPNNGSVFNNIGLALTNLGKYDEAIEYFDKVLKIDPNNIGTLNNKGMALDGSGKHTEAIEYYNKTLDIDPNYIEALNNKGNALAVLNQNEEAIQYYDKTLQIEPNNIKALGNKGMVLFKFSKFELAIEYFNKALTIEQQNIIALIGKATTLLYINNIDAEECANCFIKVNKTPLQILNIFNGDRQVNQDQLYLVVKLMIEKDPLFISATQKETNENQKQQYIDIYFQTLQIVSLLHVTGNKESEDKDFSQEREVAHYTRRDVSYNMLLKKDVNDAKEKKSPLRLNTIAKGNDPKEGKTLFDYLGIDRDCETANDDYQAFIACFTFNKQSLNQFRLYGKEEQREATGVSLVVKNSYFNNQIGFNGSLFNALNISENLSENKDSTKEDKKLSLFRCIYIDPATHQVISIGHKENYEIYRDKIDIKPADTLEEIEEKGEAIREEIKSYNNKCTIRKSKNTTLKFE